MTADPQQTPAAPKIIAESYRIKSVETLPIMTRADLAKAIKSAGYNTFPLGSWDSYFDLLNASGPTTLTSPPWLAIMSWL